MTVSDHRKFLGVCSQESSGIAIAFLNGRMVEVPCRRKQHQRHQFSPNVSPPRMWMINWWGMLVVSPLSRAHVDGLFIIIIVRFRRDPPRKKQSHHRQYPSSYCSLLSFSCLHLYTIHPVHVLGVLARARLLNVIYIPKRVLL